MATTHLSSATSLLKLKLSSSNYNSNSLSQLPFYPKSPFKRPPTTTPLITSSNASPIHGSDMDNTNSSPIAAPNSDARAKTKIVCTIGPSTSSRDMIWKLAEAGMNIARLNMSHGDHASHQKTIHFVQQYNAQFQHKVIAIMLDTKGPEVRSGDVPQPILLKEGEAFNFTIRRGVSTQDTVSVNYDDFVNDVDPGDVLLVDGGMISLVVKSKTKDLVRCEVIDGGELKSRRHLNVRGKSATLPSITDKDWEDIKFGVDNQVDFYAVSFVKDARVVYELKDYLKSHNADIHVIVKIESADSIPNLHSILSASDGVDQALKFILQILRKYHIPHRVLEEHSCILS